jgi:hypothetical protein
MLARADVVYFLADELTGLGRGALALALGLSRPLECLLFRHRVLSYVCPVPWTVYPTSTSFCTSSRNLSAWFTSIRNSANLMPRIAPD